MGLNVALERPTGADLERLARAQRIAIDADERPVILDAIDQTLNSLERVDQLWLECSFLTPPGMAGTGVPGTMWGVPSRRPGHRPTEEENPYGAWVWRADVRERSEGPLAGSWIALKDNIAVAGMPMSDGSPLLDGFMPSVDATVARRVLEAGGEIRGKATCEALCFSGGSHTSYPWPVRNPRDPSRMAGGSSSGSAALVASGAVEMAIGGDQAGSVRIPASWCGIVGLKPTFGLVPYTGALSLEPTYDHLGPMAKDVARVALLLEVLAGRDGLDPRQIDTPSELPPYTGDLRNGSPAPVVGVVSEGFGWPGVSEVEVDAAVRASLEVVAACGARMREVSIPWHRDGIHVWDAVTAEGVWSGLVRDRLAGYGFPGPREPEIPSVLSAGMQADPGGLPPGVRVVALLGAHVAERYHGAHYAKGQALRVPLRDAYDRALADLDVLAMPTTPWGPPLLDEAVSRAELLRRTAGPIENTCPFDLSGHPAISIPCGTANGLPVGLMLVGRRFDEARLLRAAAWIEGALT